MIPVENLQYNVLSNGSFNFAVYRKNYTYLLDEHFPIQVST